MPRQYYVYIVTNPRRTVLYTGVTNDLVRRAWQHRNGQGGRFTAKYQCSQLVLYEVFRIHTTPSRERSRSRLDLAAARSS